MKDSIELANQFKRELATTPASHIMKEAAIVSSAIVDLLGIVGKGCSCEASISLAIKILADGVDTILDEDPELRAHFKNLASIPAKQ